MSMIHDSSNVSGLAIGYSFTPPGVSDQATNCSSTPPGVSDQATSSFTPPGVSDQSSISLTPSSVDEQAANRFNKTSEISSVHIVESHEMEEHLQIVFANEFSVNVIDSDHNYQRILHNEQNQAPATSSSEASFTTTADICMNRNKPAEYDSPHNEELIGINK
jgi:hypothetical protein